MAGELLSFEESVKTLEKAGIAFAQFKIVKTEEDAVGFAERIGYPIAIKIDSPDVIHKTESGCVKANIGDEAGLRRAYRQVIKNAGAAKIRGMMVQKMAAGKEVIIGGKTDPQFGEVIIFGLGGIFVEVLKDVSVRVTPVTKEDAMEMIREIRGYPILAGARGERSVDLDALAETIVKASKLHTSRKDITEFDLNPLFADERGVVAVDVRMIKG